MLTSLREEYNTLCHYVIHIMSYIEIPNA